MKYASAPAPASTIGSRPMPTINLTVSGVAATRRSYGRRSLTMATFIAGGFLDLRVFRKTCAAAADLGRRGAARFLALFALGHNAMLGRPDHRPTSNRSHFG